MVKIKKIILIAYILAIGLSCTRFAWARSVCGEVILSSGETCSSLSAHFLLEECGESKDQKPAQVECQEDSGWARYQSKSFLYEAHLKKYKTKDGRTFWDAPDRVQQFPLSEGSARKLTKKSRDLSSNTHSIRLPKAPEAKPIVAPPAAVQATSKPLYSSPSQGPPEVKPTPKPTSVQIPPAQAPTLPQLSPYVLSGNPNFSLQMGAFAQLRYTYLKADQSPQNQNFDVALARLALFGKILNQDTHYFFQLQSSTFGNSNGISLLDGWIRHDFHRTFSVITGRFILPYSRQFYTHPGNLLLTDLSAADYAFGLTRSLGVGVTGNLGRLTYYLNLINSSPALDAAGQHGTGQSLGSVGRVELDLLDSYGYLESDPQFIQRPQLSIGIAAATNPIAQDSLFQNVKAGQNTTNLTADLGFRIQKLSFQSAFYYRHESGGPTKTSADSTGFYSQIGYYLMAQRLEAAARYSYVHFGQLNTQGSFQNSSEPSFGLNYYFLGHHLKLQGDYTLYSNQAFDGSDSKSNQVRIQTQILF